MGVAMVLVVVAGAWLVLGRWRRPNVLLVTIDTLRPDRLHCYGHRTNRTPNIDNLALQGTRFANAFCDVTWTTPSMSSVMTGTYAVHHGMRSTYQQLDAANVTLAEVLKQHGYLTAAIIGSFPLDHTFGLDQGFDSYDDRFTAPIMIHGDSPAARIPSQFSEDFETQRMYQYLKLQADAYRPNDQESDAAIAWLKQKPREPFFLWVHYFGPHELTDAHLTAQQQDEHNASVYDSDVERTDTEVGRLLAVVDYLGLKQRTVTILHADHGQSLGEHWYVGHGKDLYDPTLRIPLIVRFPGVVPPAKVVDKLARNVDIMPTVLDLAHIPFSHPLDGESLRPLWRDDPPATEREVYCETYLPATEAFATDVPDGHGGTVRVGFRRRGIRTLDWKLIVNEPWPLLDYGNDQPQENLGPLESEELFDLHANGMELTTGIVKDPPEVEQRLQQQLASYAATSRPPGPHRALDEAAMERLRSLGYVH